ncbi:lysozyme family protein [Novosphingobium chloroacetimidivorans]|uniref:Lysozyme family protein n=1 Tax=Novosphingobium chloroacetimidivorans TaxID=1428314 RepID=A0A7W7K697_9SPHN|nr:lysozyme family protein [Novosphingobium chloroacetimidivorans]
MFSDPGNVLALDNLLDAFGVPVDGKADTFDRCLAVILKHEGGYVDHPKDPGGATNLGVTKATWEGYVRRAVSKADIRALTIEKVKPLYRKNYWDAVSGDNLPAGLALCVFDFAVNAGPARANRYLQALVGSAQDGKTGPATVSAAQAFVAAQGERTAVQAYQAARRGYYRSLGTFSTFGRGWLRRVDETEAEALEMVQ